MRRIARDEPLTINAEVVSDFLERQGCPSMASFVRSLGGAAQRANIREMQIREAYDALVRETAPTRTEADRREPDGYRSEWD